MLSEALVYKKISDRLIFNKIQKLIFESIFILVGGLAFYIFSLGEVVLIKL